MWENSASILNPSDTFKSILHPEPCTKVKAPQVAESPVSLECKVKNITSCGSHDMFLAEVLAVDVDEAYINEKKALDLQKAGLLAYAHGFYFGLGRKIGKFGWSVEKKATRKKRIKRLQNNNT